MNKLSIDEYDSDVSDDNGTDTAGGCVGNSLTPGQNSRHFGGDIFKLIFIDELFVFRFEFHYNLFLRDQLTTSQRWFRQRLGA